MYILKLNYHMDSAHHLNDYIGACSNLHGHRWDIKITISVHELKAQNGDMLIDFKRLKGIIDELDHKCLNDVVSFNPTAENLSEYLYTKIDKELIEIGYEFPIVEVELFESPEASITYSV